MIIQEVLIKIIQKNKDSGIDVYPPATFKNITNFEKKIGFSLPNDFKEFYLTCNGFSCNEDIFNMVPLSDMANYPQDYGLNWFYFSEYMIYSDVWGVRLTGAEEYEIFNSSYPTTSLTTSLYEFLERISIGHVFETSGLYEWHQDLGIK